MLPVEVYDELMAARALALASAAGSSRAEGLEASDVAKAIVQRWSRGEISEAKMQELIRELHGLA